LISHSSCEWLRVYDSGMQLCYLPRFHMHPSAGQHGEYKVNSVSD
jgi:hypothetical protein